MRGLALLSLLAATTASFAAVPNGVYLIDSSSVSGTNPNGKRLLQFDLNGGFVGNILGPGVATFSTPQQAAVSSDGNNFLITDQIADNVQEFTPTNSFVANFATGLDNARGIHRGQDGNYYVGLGAAAGSGGPRVEKFGPTGSPLGSFINPYNGAWHCYQLRNGDWLVSSSSSGASFGVGRYSSSGSYLGDFVIGYAFTEQIYELEDGNILIAAFSTSGSNTSGVYEFTPTGIPVLRYNVAGARGCVELDNGNILGTGGSNVVEFTRGNATGTTRTDLGGSGTSSYRMFLKVRNLVGRTIEGTVDLQDLSVDESGRNVSWELLDSSSNVVESGSVALGTGGSYSINPTVTSGTFTLTMKGAHWLRGGAESLDLSSNLSGINFSLKNGDVDGDNEVGPGDFSDLSSAFGSMSGDANWNANADVDEDGEVGPSDFSSVSTNFGETGY